MEQIPSIREPSRQEDKNKHETEEEEEEDDDEYEEEEEEEVDGGDMDEEEDDLEDNLIDAEELNNYRRLQEMSSKIEGGKKNKSRLTESLSRDDSLGSEVEEDPPIDLPPISQIEEEKQRKKSLPRQSEGDNQMKKFSHIKSFQTTAGSQKYVVSADKFAKFESDLFELLGIENTPFKPANEPPSSSLNCDTIRSKIVADMSRIEADLELNPMGKMQIQTAKRTTRSTSAMAKKKMISEAMINEDEHHLEEIRSKVITVVLNQSSVTTRPRKSGRILLTKKNSTSLDSVLSEIGNIFKAVESLPIRRLFNLKGAQVTELADLFDSDDVFIAFTSDKVHSRDFDFNREELELLFAHEFMKTYSNSTPETLANSLSRKSISQVKKKTKIMDSKFDKYSAQDLDSLPKELLDNYEIGPVIGEGNYALVRECKDLNTGIKFALKIIDMKKCKGKEEMIENELKILRKAIHPNIIKLVEDFRTDEFVYMVLEFYKGGDLLEALAKRGGKYTELETSQIVHCLASAVAYLHSINIVHRDLKLENIFIQQHADNSISLKLGDFGLATICTEPLNQKCGSPIYVAPEILLEKTYRFEVDVWSLGIITYVLLCGYAPFQGETDEETFTMIKNQELMFSDQEWSQISPEVKDMIRKMLNRNQAERIKASEVMEFKWPVLNNRNQNSGRKKSPNKLKIANKQSGYGNNSKSTTIRKLI